MENFCEIAFSNCGEWISSGDDHRDSIPGQLYFLKRLPSCCNFRSRILPENRIFFWRKIPVDQNGARLMVQELADRFGCTRVLHRNMRIGIFKHEARDQAIDGGVQNFIGHKLEASRNRGFRLRYILLPSTTGKHNQRERNGKEFLHFKGVGVRKSSLRP